MKIQTLILSQPVNLEEYRQAQVVVAVDDSTGDAAHEANIDRLIHLTRQLPVPFVAQGNIQKLEDVKKFLYAGAKRVLLQPEQTRLQEEAAARFGADKVITSLEQLPELQAAFSWGDFKLGPDGLMPVVVQDYRTDQVLMVAYMNQEAYERTLATGRMTYWSRSRQELWEKGATSGHYQYVKSLSLDCDADTILARVAQVGAACHTGHTSCFYRPILEDPYPEANLRQVLEDVYGVIQDRKQHPKEGSYTNYLFDKGVDKICKKIGEEATEIVIAAKNPNPEEIKYEISDFLYHAMVLMVEKQVTWGDILEELANR